MNSHLQRLIAGHLDDSLTPEESAELNTLLKSDPEAAPAFAKASLLHHALRESFQTGTIVPLENAPVVPSKEAAKPKNVIPFQKALPWAIATAACLVAAFSLFSTPLPPLAKKANTEAATPVDTHTMEIHDSGFAVLTRVVDPLWVSSNPPSQSDFLPAGHYQMTQGMAQIEFLSGVSVVLEGQASFEILSADEMRLTEGKIRAHVPPPAIGFKIHTPQGTVLDLGTEFALDLSGTNPELHVIDGEVEWHPAASPDHETLLTEGQAIALTDGARKDSEPLKFTSADQLAQHVETTTSRQFQQWKSHSQSLRNRADLVAYFPMENLTTWNRELAPTQPDLSAGAIVAAEVVEGRWRQKTALDFSPNGSRVRLNVPGEFDQITFATWAKIDSLDRRFNALFLTDNYDAGEPHWQLLSDGCLFFSVRLDDPEAFHFEHVSSPVWNHADSQQWLHLVTTYDCATRTASHYLNGQLLSQTQAPAEKTTPVIRLGNAQLGNWGLPTKADPDFAVRNLNGSLDEFAIFNTALSPSQIQNLYQKGHP